MAWPYKEVTFDLLGGYNAVHNPADILQVPRQPQLGTLDPGTPVRMAQAQDVWSPNLREDLATRPGFSEVRGTTISASGRITGMRDQAAIATRFLLTVSINGGTHSVYQDSANPPAEITSGTNFTESLDNLTTLLNFTDGTNRGTIILSRQRNTPQFINSSGVRSDFTIAGTGLTALKPAIGEIFGQRGLYADVDFDGTVHKNRLYRTDIRDGNLITDPTTQFDSFERSDQDDQIRGVKRISDFCIVGGRDFLELMAINTVGSNPFRRQEVPGGVGKGPMSHQGMITAQQRVAWAAISGIFSLEGAQGEVLKEWTAPIKTYWTGLEQSRMEFISAGYDQENDIGCFAVTPSGGTSHTRVVAINFSRPNENYIWTLTRNAFANRIVSGQQRLIGGGLGGKFYNEIRTSVFTGNADDAAGTIDADAFTPRHHCGLPGIRKLFAGIKVTFDQQGTSEAVTVQYRLNDESSWSSFAASPYTVAGTAGDFNQKFFPLMKAGTLLQIRFRDANSGQAFRVTKYSIMYKELEAGLV